MNYEQVARDVLAAVGGKENVSSVIHCVTRLRFKLKNRSIVDTDQVKQVNGVMTVVESGDNTGGYWYGGSLCLPGSD